MALTLVLADDHQIVRQGLRELLRTVSDFQLVGETADGPSTVRVVEEIKPDVLVLDLMLPGLSGLEVARQVGRISPATRIVVLSMHSNEAYVVEALRAGAIAYVFKEASAENLVMAVYEAAAGRRYFSPPLSEETLAAYVQSAEGKAPDPLQTLTNREKEVLTLTVEGHSRTGISERLFISPRTVESHRANVMRKLNVRNLKELIRYAVERGVLPRKE